MRLLSKRNVIDCFEQFSLATWLDGVPVARNIPAAHVTHGRTCAVLFFDASNLSDAVVLAVYE